MRSIICYGVIVVCLWFKMSLAHYLQEAVQPVLSPEDCYYTDTYKTDFGPSDELVRSERSFLKKLFKNWGKRLNDCVPCCQNNAEYSASAVPAGNVDYSANGNYDNNNNYQESGQYNEPAYYPPDSAPGRHGMIYLPLPHPHRIMTHLHGYFNRSFRRGGTPFLYSGYPPPAAYGEQKPAVAPVNEANAPAYEAPAEVEEVQPAYPEQTEYSSVENVKPAYPKKTEYSTVKKVKPADPEKTEYSSVEEVQPTYSAKQDYAGSAESSEEKKSDYKEVQKSGNSYVAAQPQVTPQIVQSIVPIVVPPVYIYPPPYYPPPAPYGQSLVYQSPAPAYSPPSSSYSAPTPSTAFSTSSYSPPASSYSPPPQSYSPPATGPSYTPPSSSYSPSPQSYSPPATDTSYAPPSSSYSMPYSSLDTYNYSPSPNYFKRTYSTSLTYLLPPTPPCSNAPSYSNYDSDQPMRSCPELFTSYGDDLGSSHPY